MTPSTQAQVTEAKRSPYWALQPEALYNAAIDTAIQEFNLKPECRHDRHDIAVKIEKIWNAVQLPSFIKSALSAPPAQVDVECGK